MRPLFAAVIALAACGADPSSLSQPDLRMRDLSVQQPMECANGFTDGEETDQDCGGPTCTPCDTGKSCKMARDCLSMFCTNGVCDAPSCMDGVKNGSESDQDCGGSCAGCAVGKKCNAGTDCASMTCTNGTCALGQCMNMKQDGAETDVDCGGGSCPACGDGKMCQQGSDCVGMTCTNNVCKGALMCMAGTADCDGNAGNGCEVSTNTDAKNCGGCGKACGGGTPDCQSGVCKAQSKVLLVFAESGQQAADVRAALMATGAFAAIDTFSAEGATPDVATLKNYAAALVWSDNGFKDSAMLGNNLADYFDGGGRVVLAMFCIQPGAPNQVTGRWGDPQGPYLLFEPSGVARASSPAALGQLLEPQSPLMNGVKAFQAVLAYRTLWNTKNGAVVVASWNDGTPLIVRGTAKGRRIVNLNFYPVSGAFDKSLWTGDGAIMMRNALLYQ